MVNQSQKNDPRFWNKWQASGAVESYDIDKSSEITYMIGIYGKLPSLDQSLSRGEKVSTLKEYAKGIYRIAREKLQNYPQIEILNDELFLVYALLAKSSIEYAEKTFDTLFAKSGNKLVMKKEPKIPEDLKDIVKSIKLQRKIVPM